jgi:hypothetical protein
MDRRDMSFGFRVIVGPGGNIDAAEDTLRAWIAPGYPQRLVYQTDSGALWYTVGYNPSIKQTTVADNKAMTAYVDFTVTWRIRPDWRPRFSEASDVWGVNDGVWGTNDGIWGAAFAVALNANPTTFTIDATGVAGSNLPTIPDTGPVFTLTGVFGGDSGIVITNNTALVTNTTNARVPMNLGLPSKLLAGSTWVADCGAQRFTLNGTLLRPTRPAYQREWMRIVPGVVNTLSITAYGTNALVGGSVTAVNVSAPGTGYTSAPTVAFSGGGGTGAAGIAIIAGGGVIGVFVTNPGIGYTSAPTVAFSGGGGSGAAAAAGIFGSVTVDWWRKRA